MWSLDPNEPAMLIDDLTGDLLRTKRLDVNAPPLMGGHTALDEWETEYVFGRDAKRTRTALRDREMETFSDGQQSRVRRYFQRNIRWAHLANQTTGLPAEKSNEEQKAKHKSNEQSRLVRDWMPALGYKKYDGHIFVCGSTNSGKSFFIKKMLLRDNLKRPIFLITDLEKLDPSLKELLDVGRLKRVRQKARNKKLDVTIDKFQSEIRARSMADGCIVLIDDVAPSNREIGALRDRILEKGRHRKITAVVVNHQMRGGRTTKTLLTDSEFIVCFPGANRTIVNGFMKDLMQIPSWQRRMLLDQSAEDGRQMMIHLWNPNFVATTQSTFIL